MGVVALPAANVPALAKTKAAKIISTKAIKKTAYHAKFGYLYSSAKLTKKLHNATNYPNTTFYATKSTKVKRRNGKTAVYYYVKNKKGNVKGWIWHGNLSKIDLKDLAQRKSDIKKTIAAIKLMSGVSADKDYALQKISVVNVAHAYNAYSDSQVWGLPYAIAEIHGQEVGDGQAIIQATTNFKGRFDSVTNASLEALSDRVSEAIDSGNGGDINTSARNLANALADAVMTLD